MNHEILIGSGFKDPYFMIFMAYEMLLISLGSITPLYTANN